MSPEETNSWTELRGVLDKQRQSFMMLFDVLKKKEKVLVKGDTDKMKVIVADEEEIIKSSDELEKRRIELVLVCMGRDSNPPTLTELLEAAPEDEKDKIENSALELMRSLKDVAAANRGNAELVKESMNFVTYFMNLLTSDWALDSIYESSGKLKEGEVRVIGKFNQEA